MERKVITRIILAGVYLAIVAGGLVWWLTPSRARRSAEAALKQGRLDEALAGLETALAWRRDDETLIRYSQTLELAKRGDDAIAVLRTLSPETLQSENVMLNLGRLIYTSHRPTEAERIFRECIQKFPNNVRARQFILDICRWEKREMEARLLRQELFDIAAKRNLEDRLWVGVRTFADEFLRVETNENWEYLLACWNRDKNDPDIRIAMARHLIITGDRTEEAAEDLEKLLPFKPKSVSAIASLLHFYLLITKGDLQRCRKLLDDWPAEYRFEDYWRYEGIYCEKTNQDEKAIEAYRKALGFRADDRQTLTRMTPVLTRVGKRTQNDKLLEEAKANGQMLLEVQKRWSGTEERYQRIENWTKAFDAARKAGEPPPEPDVLQELVDFYGGLGRTRESNVWKEIVREIESRRKAIIG